LQGELEPSEPLINYLRREDFWAEGFSPKIEELEKNFPPKIKLMHSQWLIEKLDKMKEMLKKGERPSLSFQMM